MSDEKDEKSKPPTGQQPSGGDSGKGTKPTRMSQIIFDHAVKGSAHEVAGKVLKESTQKKPVPPPPKKEKK